MSTPVTAIMLTCDRPQMTARAVKSFEAQTYKNKRLVIFDTSTGTITRYRGHFQHCEIGSWRGRTIGALRNAANQYADVGSLIAHFDSDDISHPRRLEEQVTLLEASGKACVGYRELLFWDTRSQLASDFSLNLPAVSCGFPRDEAWLYRGQDPRWVCGASMLYTRQSWEACPFDDAPGEDRIWWLKNAEKCVGISAIDPTRLENFQAGDSIVDDGQPRMVCGIHGANTEAYSRADMLSGGGGVWQRAPEFDSYCERTMRL